MPLPPMQRVVAVTAIEDVAAAGAGETVVAAEAQQHIGAGIAGKVSARLEPMRFSIPISVSPDASPPDACRSQGSR